ncbi:MAG: hypothetical protein MZV49_06690 [Rhodopseudomonas palustris]|nr:hypothetical protein [Rhodopseudomonas palustris]
MEDSGSVQAIAALHGREARRAARDPGGGARRRAGDLRRRQPVRRVLRARARWRRRCSATPTSRSRLMPAAIALGTLDLHHVGAAGHAGDPERDPDALLRHHAVRGAGPRHHRRRPSCWRSACGGCARARARRAAPRRRLRRRAPARAERRPTIRWCASARPTAQRVRPGRDPRTAERSDRAAADLVAVAAARGGGGASTSLMSLLVLPRLDIELPRRGALGRRRRSRAVGGVWSVIVALGWRRSSCCSRCNRGRLPTLRDSDGRRRQRLGAAGAQRGEPGRLRRGRRRAAGLRAGARLGAGRSRAGRWCRWRVSTNVLAALTGSASGGLTIALEALGATYMQLAAELGHRPGADAPRRGDRRRHARQPAAQRRRRDAAGGLRRDPPGKLLRHRHGRHRRRRRRARTP